MPRSWEPKRKPDQSAADWAADRMEAALAEIARLRCALHQIAEESMFSSKEIIVQHAKQAIQE